MFLSLADGDADLVEGFFLRRVLLFFENWPAHSRDFQS